MEATSEQKLNKGLSQAYEYIANVIKCQKRVLESKEMYSAYTSMHFKPSLSETVFNDFYLDILADWIERGILKEGKKGAK